MRGGRDAEKEMSLPMFPRLHVNDTEKGGPRVPPRNKMALYEQLSIPSQRLGSGSKPILPLPPNNSSSLAPSVSSNNGGGHETIVSRRFYNSPESSGLVEKRNSGSSIGVIVNRGNKDKGYGSSDVTGPFPATCKYSPSQQFNFPNFKNFSVKKLGNKADLRVPTWEQSGIVPYCGNIHQSKGQENTSKFYSRLLLQTVGQKQIKGKDFVDSNSARDWRKHRLSQNSQDVVERSGDKVLTTASSDVAIKDKNLEPLKRPSAQVNESSPVYSLKGLDGTNTELSRENVINVIFGENTLVEPGRSISRGNSLKGRTELSFRSSLGTEREILGGLEKRRKVHEEKKTGSIPATRVSRDDNILGTSVVKSFSPLDISPDDVVGIIGEKLFWKARRAIVNQQRVFAVQVFELHRLLKVQKLIAGSVALIQLDDTLYVRKPSFDITPVKNLPSIEPSAIVNHSTHKPNPSIERADERAVAMIPLPPVIECAGESAIAKVPLPSVNSNTCERRVTSKANYEASLGNTPSAPMSINDGPSPWCFSPPGSQWLVPIMSPSEGLIYKPYTGPCPPNTGFMAPVYGSYGQINMAPGSRNFLNTPYGVSSFTGVQSKDNQPSEGDMNFPRPQQSSCNLSSQMSQAALRCTNKVVRSKERQIQGSTASTPSKKAKGNVLSLFPTEPTAPASDHQHPQTQAQKTQVIKAVPLNPRLATASAARIFQSIQEERRRASKVEIPSVYSEIIPGRLGCVGHKVYGFHC